MKGRSSVSVLALITFVHLLVGCKGIQQSVSPHISQGTFGPTKPSMMLLDFESPTYPVGLQIFHAKATLASTHGVSHGQQALQLTMARDEKSAGFTFRPEIPIDATELGNYSLMFEATNLTEAFSAQFYVTVTNTAGQQMKRTHVVPIGATKTFLFELEGKYLHIDTGLRDDPCPWDMDAAHMKIIGLKTDIDFTKIAAITFEVKHPIQEKTIVFDHIRLVTNPPIPADYLVNIVDKYGQNTQVDFKGKIQTDAELKQAAEDELSALASSGPLADRGTYGGWKQGPHLQATGYFRTEKVGNQWALVDPEGYLYFSTGIANVRMANTTTFTGRDFAHDTVRYRDPEDVTPEDSRGMVALPQAVTHTAYIAYPERYQMFVELPEYGSPLANHFSYRRESHIGPFAHGETFSFYQANLERRYGEPYPGAHLDKWYDVTLDRFLSWGFTSFGNWVDTVFYEKRRLPFFANGWIIGDFQTVRSGMDYWGPMPDVFDPEFSRRVGVTVQVVAEEVKDNPWCIGVFIDNEKSWGVPGTPKGQYGIVLDALTKSATESPIKAEFLHMLTHKYESIDALNQAWETNLPSWQAFADGINYNTHTQYSDGMLADFSMLLEAYATQYFRVVHDALAQALPHHLYMGCRFAAWGMGPEVRRAAKKYVDVFSYNYYEEAVGEKDWKFLEELDRPSIIGEFHMGAMDAGLFHPGLIHGVDQADRARMYKAYMYRVIDNPYFVGAHWFQYLDSPITGRAHDGENYNVGFVRGTDIPYLEMVEAAKAVNSTLYTRKFGP